MNNFVHKGDVLEVAAPADVSSGDGVLVGSIFGVASKNALSGERLNVQVEGVVRLPKEPTDNIAEGDKLNWDDSGKHLQKATSTLDNVATAEKAADSNESEVEAKLTPV